MELAPSPLVQKTLQRKKELSQRVNSLPWAIVNACSGLLVLNDFSNGTIARYFVNMEEYPLILTLVYLTEAVLMLLFLINTFMDLWWYFFPMVGRTPVSLTSEQMKLFGIKNNDLGFKLAPPPKPYALSPQQPPLEYESFVASTPFNRSGSILSYSWKDSGNQIDRGAQASNISLTSPTYKSTPLFMESNNKSFKRTLSSSSWTYTDGNVVDSKVTDGFTTPEQKQKPFTSHVKIQDEKSFDEYMKEFQDWEKKNASASSDQNMSNLSCGSPNSFWNESSIIGGRSTTGNMIMSDYSQPTKYSYQVSTPVVGTSPSGLAASDDHSMSPLSAKAELLWRRADVDQMKLVQWNENLRLWIHETILSRLVKEMDEFNKQITQAGITDVSIGSSNLDQLKKVAAQIQTLKSHSNFYRLLKFFELTLHQEYLVQRIRELAKGGCISDFKWNSGGRYKNKDWEESLPTDSEILMYFVATYFDCRLPAHVLTEYTSFSGQHFIKLPDKKWTPNADTLAIIQTKAHPPHYAVQIGEERFELPPGRNNLIHTLLLFLHHIKTKRNGIICRINFGKTGINILWVID